MVVLTRTDANLYSNDINYLRKHICFLSDNAVYYAHHYKTDVFANLITIGLNYWQYCYFNLYYGNNKKFIFVNMKDFDENTGTRKIIYNDVLWDLLSMDANVKTIPFIQSDDKKYYCWLSPNEHISVFYASSGLEAYNHNIPLQQLDDISYSLVKLTNNYRNVNAMNNQLYMACSLWISQEYIKYIKHTKNMCVTKPNKVLFVDHKPLNGRPDKTTQPKILPVVQISFATNEEACLAVDDINSYICLHKLNEE